MSCILGGAETSSRDTSLLLESMKNLKSLPGCIFDGGVLVEYWRPRGKRGCSGVCGVALTSGKRNHCSILTSAWPQIADRSDPGLRSDLHMPIALYFTQRKTASKLRKIMGQSERHDMCLLTLD
jgi:hypothetical protein